MAYAGHRPPTPRVESRVQKVEEQKTTQQIPAQDPPQAPFPLCLHVAQNFIHLPPSFTHTVSYAWEASTLCCWSNLSHVSGPQKS